MKVKQYSEPEAGEWVLPVQSGYKLACCDCGLVHILNFRIKDGQVEVQFFRDNRATGQMRRHKLLNEGGS